jgi:hypothetical protein
VAGHFLTDIKTVGRASAWHGHFDCFVEPGLAFDLFNDWEKKKGDSFMTVPVFARLKIREVNKS